MKGKHTIHITSRRAAYTLELSRKVSVIKGNSGTGKSSMIRLISDYLELGKDSGIKIAVSSSAELMVLSNTSDWQNILSAVKNTILFIDEDVRYIYTKAFQQELWEADCYAVIISRSGRFNGLPFAIGAVYELATRESGKGTVTEMYQLYDEKHEKGDFSLFLTEDSNSGFEMAKLAFDTENTKVISAKGNSSVLEALMKEAENQTAVCADVDGAAFGPYIEPLLKYAELRGNTWISAPESFEFILLHIDGIRKYLSADTGELYRTYDFCDSKEYISWERYYEDLLNSICSEHLGFSYSKIKLNSYFDNASCAELFMHEICRHFVQRRN